MKIILAIVSLNFLMQGCYASSYCIPTDNGIFVKKDGENTFFYVQEKKEDKNNID